MRGDRVNVQVDHETNELLKIIKRRLRAKTLGEVIKSMSVQAFPEDARKARENIEYLKSLDMKQPDKAG